MARSKLGQKMRAPRTGVALPPTAPYLGVYKLSDKATYSMGPSGNGSNGNGNPGSNGMRGGNGNGKCGTVQTIPMSWGAGCPPGQCTAADLAAGLNRSFAGESYGCRELPYWLSGTADGDGVLTLSQNSLVTICPTRMIIMSLEDDDLANAFGLLTEFTIGNQNQIVGDPIPFLFFHPDSYQVIPFVTDCIRAGMPFTIKLVGNVASTKLYVGLIGPAIG